MFVVQNITNFMGLPNNHLKILTHGAVWSGNSHLCLSGLVSDVLQPCVILKKDDAKHPSQTKYCWK